MTARWSNWGFFVQDDDGRMGVADGVQSEQIGSSKRQRSAHFEIRTEKIIKYTLQIELQYSIRDS
jgi:hypothetical protein